MRRRMRMRMRRMERGRIQAAVVVAAGVSETCTLHYITSGKFNQTPTAVAPWSVVSQVKQMLGMSSSKGHQRVTSFIHELTQHSLHSQAQLRMLFLYSLFFFSFFVIVVCPRLVQYLLLLPLREIHMWLGA